MTRTLRAVVVLFALTGASVASCASPASEPAGQARRGVVAETPVAEESARPVESDLPCAIQATFARYCWNCHGNPPRFGTRLSLATRADLLAPDTRWSPFDRVADRVLVRMAADAYPMPPRPEARVPPLERDVFAAWVEARLPTFSGADGGCGAPDAD